MIEGGKVFVFPLVFFETTKTIKMRTYVSDIAFSEVVKEVQKENGLRTNYSRMEQMRGWQNRAAS